MKHQNNFGSKVVVKENIDPEEISAKEQFFNRINNAPEWAINLVEMLLRSFENAENIEIHYTRVAGGQLRIRKFLERRAGGQNITTIHWKPLKNAFECRVYAPYRFCNENGFNADDISEQDPLKAKFEYHDKNSSKMLLNVIKYSILQAR